MQPTVNRSLFTTTSFDSGALGPLASLLHRFTQAGRHHVIVRRHDRHVGTLEFEVDEASTRMQLDLDLASARSTAQAADCACHGASSTLPKVSPHGYVLLHATQGDGYAATVTLASHPSRAVFDSQRLEAGDLFALSLLEPTRYTVLNRIDGAQGQIEVRFSPEWSGRLRDLETCHVDVRPEGFDPAQVSLIATQGVVFRMHAAARVVIERCEPAKDGARRGPRRFARVRPGRGPAGA